MQIPDNDAKLQEYNKLRTAMLLNPQKYEFDSTELRAFKPAKNSIHTADLYSSWFVTDNDLNLHRFKSRYNDKTDGLERDNQMYLEEETKLFHASIITMTTLLFASIYIASSR
jgi:hypothetical protein